ncbi:MAG: hypothetical protein K5893_08590 [Prevotella sp.]|nr:hypothetical protein [Prevotella sp.]
MAIESYRHHRRASEEDPQDKYIVLRQWLNALFMIGAVVGVALYFMKNETIGTIVILVSMVFKMAECVFRFIK